MPSDQGQTSTGHLHSALANEARPSHYRGKVRSLLGVPEKTDGQPAFSPTLPPVGFKYTDRETGLFPRLGSSATTFGDLPGHVEESCPAENPVSAPLGEGHRTAGVPEGKPCAEPDTLLPDAAGQDAQPGAHVAPSERTHRNEAKNLTPTRREVPRYSATRNGKAADWLSEQPVKDDTENATTLSTESSNPPAHDPEAASAPVKRTYLEIPGVSEERLSFPTVRSTEQGNDGGIQESGPSASRADNVTSGGLPRYKRDLQIRPETVEEDGQPDAVDHASSATPNRPPRYKPNLQIRPITVEEGGQPDAADHASSATPNRPPRYKRDLQIRPETVEEDGQPDAADHAFSVTPNRPPRFTAGDEPEPDRTPVPVIRGEGDTASRPGADTVARIEQLRHAVHQLAAKVSSQPARANDETQARQPEQPSPPPAQPIVVVNRPSVQRRMPRAFWERRYLSRLHLRTLR